MLRILACGLLAVASVGQHASLEVPSTGECKEDCSEQGQSMVALMQMKSDVQKPLYVERFKRAATPAARAELLKPVAWLHPMKCGSSLFNVLIGLDSLWEDCPEEVRLDPASEKMETNKALSATLEQCTGVFGEISATCTDVDRCWWGGHMSIGTIYKGNKGHFVAMFRSPKQLLLSGYNELHAWFGEQPPKNAMEYAVTMQGCQTKMLARDRYFSPCRSDLPQPPTASEVTLAKKRLRAGFAWVGITDEWDMSICTFHAKFGGACLASDFADVNPGVNKTVSSYDESVLHDWEDEADNQIFQDVQLMMDQDMKRYHVDFNSCSSWCFSAAVSA